MYRAMQNPDTPNLPFAQTMYRDMQNDDTPNLPFAQGRPSKYVYYNYIVNGDHWTFGKMVNKKVRWTEDNAQQYRNKGYSVVRESDTPTDALGKEVGKTGQSTKPASSPHWTQTEITDLIKAEHQDDIDLLHEHAVNFGKTLNINWDKAKIQRDRIDKEIGKTRATQQEFHDKFTELGRALKAHELIPHNIIPPIGFPDITTLMIIGLVGIMVLKK